MKTWRIIAGFTGCVAAVSFGGCEDIPGGPERIPIYGGGAGNEGPELPALPVGLGVGETCSAEDPCRPGLSCESDVCEPGMSQELGARCLIGPECAEGLTCQFGMCAEAGSAEVGEGCTSDLDCASGLRCGLNGFSSECMAAGEGDFGDECEGQSDCFQGLYCVEGACKTPLEVPIWEGVECPEQDDENVVALFNIPGADGTPTDSAFFDHPYPSDIRLGSNGRPDLDGFPTPGPGLLGVDLVAEYVKVVEAETDGWSTNPSVIFRFSGRVDIASLKTPEGEMPRVFIADVDALPALPADGLRPLSTNYALGSGSKYVCDDWFALRTPRNTLVPGHRYIAWISRDARSGEGDAIARSPQFEAMLTDTAPSGDAVLSKAHAAFAPLREFMAFYEGSPSEVDPDSLLIATVFTTQNALDPMRALATAVEGTPVPTASDWVKCAEGAVSPCPQADAALGRACGEGTADYDEYQALVSLPIFQEGTAPYLKEGGAIASTTQRTEAVCMSMSIPKVAAPAAGWPLVIYGHGTGGSYRGALRDQIAGRLARATPEFATLTIDAVQHGPRRGEGPDAENDPDNLFFNFLNPDAARGNPLQGAADVLSLLRFAATSTLASAADTGASAITVDPGKVFLYGHSQGSTHGSIALPFSAISGGVLSGNGGGLALALMNKTNPVNIAGAIPFALQDADPEGALRMGEKHPAVSLLQHYIDPADPINFAPLLTVRPEVGRTVKHVFQTFGLDDTYSPPETLASFIYAAELALAEPPSGVSATGDNDLGMTPVVGAVTANVTVDTTTVTAVCRQYEPPADSDGHFVAEDVPAATDDVIGFLSSLGAAVAPTVPAP